MNLHQNTEENLLFGSSIQNELIGSVFPLDTGLLYCIVTQWLIVCFALLVIMPHTYILVYCSNTERRCMYIFHRESANEIGFSMEQHPISSYCYC